jgi:hypothetical protein
MLSARRDFFSWGRKDERGDGHAENEQMNGPRGTVLVGALCCAFLAACGGSGSGGANDGVEGSATVSLSVEPAAPLEGAWRSGKVTVADLYAAGEKVGLSRSETKAEFWGAPSVLPLTFEITIKDGNWIEIEIAADGDEEIGWHGTYEIGDDGTVIATDPCGSITYEYVISDDTLTIDMVEDECLGFTDTNEGELLAQTLIYESTPFTRVS